MTARRRSAARLLAVILAVVPAAAAALDSRFFATSDGVRLHVLEGGSPRTPVIAFVPGWSMPADIWRFQLQALGACGVQLPFAPRLQEGPAEAETGLQNHPPRGRLGHAAARRASQSSNAPRTEARLR